MQIPRPDLDAAGRAVLSLLIVAYLLLSILTLLPDSPARDSLLQPVYRYWRALGLAQGFSVFTPCVPTRNTWMAAVVTMKDGTAALWAFPRMSRLSIWNRMREERYRKWWQDHLMSEYYAFLLPDAARFTARKFNNPKNPPASVAIYSFSRPVPAPGTAGSPPADVARKLLISYKVRAEDLE